MHREDERLKSFVENLPCFADGWPLIDKKFREMVSVARATFGYWGIRSDKVRFEWDFGRAVCSYARPESKDGLIVFHYRHVGSRNRHFRNHIAMHEATHFMTRPHDGFFKKRERQVNRELFGYEIHYRKGNDYRKGPPIYAVSLKDLEGKVLWTDEEEEDRNEEHDYLVWLGGDASDAAFS